MWYYYYAGLTLFSHHSFHMESLTCTIGGVQNIYILGQFAWVHNILSMGCNIYIYIYIYIPRYFAWGYNIIRDTKYPVTPAHSLPSLMNMTLEWKVKTSTNLKLVCHSSKTCDFMFIQALNCVSGPTKVSGKWWKRRAESGDYDFVEEKENKDNVTKLEYNHNQLG